jgi:hypothetical protein
MTTPRDPDRLIHAFLAEGPDRLPDRTYDTLRGDLDRTRQRVVIGPWREAHMNTFAKLAIGLAAVMVVAIVALNLPAGSGPGGAASPSPTVTPSPTGDATPSPSPTPAAIGSFPPVGPLAAGTYEATSDFDLVPFSFTVPDGWQSRGWFLTNASASDGRFPVHVHFVPVTDLYADPCLGTLVSPTVGPSVEDLAAAVAVQAGAEDVTTADVTVDGRPAKFVQYTIPADYSCVVDKFLIWSDGESGDLYEEPPFGETVRMWILDVDGKRFVITAVHHSTTTEADQSEVQGVVDSVTFP